jgi:hypothetical protein
MNIFCQDHIAVVGNLLFVIRVGYFANKFNIVFNRSGSTDHSEFEDEKCRLSFYFRYRGLSSSAIQC